MKNHILLIALLILLTYCQKPEAPMTKVPQWTTHEISLEAQNQYDNGYTDVDVWAVFKNQQEDSLVRPAFWDGGNTWKIRFAPPDDDSEWHWQTYASVEDEGLQGNSGSIQAISYSGDNRLLRHGLLGVSNGNRNVVHADGTPFLVVGGTPWAIPFRATAEQVDIYAADRQEKGFNAALLMSVQPDMYAEGPEARDSILGFDRGFADLSEGHLNQLKPDYFQYVDSLMRILVDHEIVPVYQPVFHGFGWKGKTVLGPTADPDEYARYCKYLVARYGSMPAFWLVGGDGDGLAPGIKPGGEIIEKWDTYHQPTGIHYNPCDNWLAPWAAEDSSGCFHYNKSYQAEPWLDFQWAQSGHDGKHLYYKVEEMYENKPTKAVANGEPTYEGMQGGKVGLGWWQGHEAWMQLMHGGTMGVVYGAAGLWQWKVTDDEPGWDEWTDQSLSWDKVMKLEGSKYVGLVSKAFEGFDFTDMEKRWDLTDGDQPLLAVPGSFYISYLEEGGDIAINTIPEGLEYYWYNPKTGDVAESGETGAKGVFSAPDDAPWVFIAGSKNN